MAFNALGQALACQGGAADAVAAYRSAIERHRGGALANVELEVVWSNLARALEKVGDTTAAIAAYESALALRPDERRNLDDLTDLLLRSGEPGGAVEVAKRLVQLSPNDAGARAKLATALDQAGDLAAAESELTKALALWPESQRAPRAHALAQRANVRQRLGRLGDAETDVNASIAIDGRNAAAFVVLAELEMRRKQFAPARDHLQRALSLMGKDESPVRGIVEGDLGLCLNELCELARARESLERALRMVPDDAQHKSLRASWYRRLGAIHCTAGEWELAEAATLAAVAAEPDGDSWEALAGAREKRGKYDEAREAAAAGLRVAKEADLRANLDEKLAFYPICAAAQRVAADLPALVVVGVRPGTQAARLGIRVGDVVLALENHRTPDELSFTAARDRTPTGVLHCRRGGRNVDFRIEPGVIGVSLKGIVERR